MTLDQKIRQDKALARRVLFGVPEEDVRRLREAVVAVLDLHPAEVRHGDTYCGECVDSYEDPVLYPCRTVEAIANALGIPS